MDKAPKIGMIGLGYVGLPLATAFSKEFEVLGFDLNEKRIKELKDGYDRTGEVSSAELTICENLTFSKDEADLQDCSIFVVAVPTPIDEFNVPDLTALMDATEIAARAINKGNLVVFESTVFPGATEDVCVPILQELSGLRLCNEGDHPLEGFHVGYSPERVNPGDPHRRLEDIVKVVSGSSDYAVQMVDSVYSAIINAGTYVAESIKIAESAKVIENVQRDVNIALVNELSKIFFQLDIDVTQVLAAASTKWNFMPFKPGLVGGHCIGVDPYYLTHKAHQIGYNPEMILAGRRVNEGMSGFVGERVVRLMIARGVNITQSKVLVLGLAFKENCPDTRNSKVVDLVKSLRQYGVTIDVWDPLVENSDRPSNLSANLIETPEEASYDAIILAVPHDQFVALGAKGIRPFGKQGHVLFDVKSVFSLEEVDGRL